MTALPASSTPTYIDLRALAQQGTPLNGQTALSAFERLADLPVAADAGLPAGAAVQWRVRAEWRERLPLGLAPELKGETANAPQLWLHLEVQASVPQTCQRCLSVYAQPVEVGRWFRFVANETTAAAEDDESEEDVLVWSPKFNLQELIEDELLMALPLVPMHEVCPKPVRMSVGEEELGPELERPNPFAALVALKGGKKGS
ncbi:MAG TPA: YceD family protein [Macromonas sp.]|nr:YceD family protein [Macromonas sp.]